MEKIYKKIKGFMMLLDFEEIDGYYYEESQESTYRLDNIDIKIIITKHK